MPQQLPVRRSGLVDLSALSAVELRKRGDSVLVKELCELMELGGDQEEGVARFDNSVPFSRRDA